MNKAYPFGMIQPGRKYSVANTQYRYSINGQEKESEINENITTALYWEYDSRIGRRWNIDPKGTAGQSPYACFSNSPINRVDIYGDKDSTVTMPNGGTMLLPDGAKITQVLNSKTMQLIGGGTVYVQQGSVSAFEFKGDTYEARWRAEDGSFAGYAKNGISGQEAPSLTYANSSLVETHIELTKPSTKEAGKVFTAGMSASATTAELPPVAAIGAATTTVLTSLAFLGSSMLIVTTVQNMNLTFPVISTGGYVFAGKTLNDLVPGSVKRSPSWNDGYGYKTPEEIKELAKSGDKVEQKMKKLWEQAERLLEKNRNKRK